MSPASFNELIDLLSKVKTVEDIHAACSMLCERFGFDHFAYGTRIATSFVRPHYIFISGYPKEWWSRYTENGYLSIDPIVSHCSKRLTPIHWEELAPQEKEDRFIKRVMGEAREFGLKSGISFPIHTPYGESATLNLATALDHACARNLIHESMPQVHLFTAYLHEAIRKVFSQQTIPLKPVQLTQREKECLLWATEGKTAWETSQILSVSERTVVFHLQNATTKLNVVNRQQAIARAVSLGLITPII